VHLNLSSSTRQAEARVPILGLRGWRGGHADWLQMSAYVPKRTFVVLNEPCLNRYNAFDRDGKPNYPRIPSVPKGVLIW
jgi:hypothetical protein